MYRKLPFALALAGVCIFPAHAHVTVHPDAGAAGSYFQTAFTVPHGCDGSPTVALRVRIPAGITAVKPQFKPGWTVTVHRDGQAIDRVEWRGGPLPDDLYDSFGLIVKLPDTPGQMLLFPVTQECAQGRVEWRDPPMPAGHAHHDGSHPAPAISVLPADAP